ncbi:D-alanyl-D-alanine dipeptidase [Sansalvadorimonas sp. 2012CJ34-2]|uniref:D-alanyl-D-alanine dipeptidase n=1 Tax=Parendozoicomonas callyspongiae TaxID=2942213 RepID=A0ABT0PJG8_9GAMM|nr:D-alanyl-D-alanine dipeptidase [Sansalvadorimonas sp. 2012CJ34-2]MCL6271121.1 D-alanyl-D-alanine dipeptidase [Sansalvadorimonas sp. 2012CJ34-2]
MLESLVQLSPDHEDWTIDLRLAGTNNFTGQQVYRKALACLHRDAFNNLEKAVLGARKLGYRLHIWDVFRPLEAQQKLWGFHPDARYISPPDNGPRNHCRGIAVDLTLERMNSGELLEMGTGFDDFGELAHHNNLEIEAEALNNRLVLAGLMHTAGFICHPFEWWHYELPDLERYPVLSDRLAGTDMM